MHPGGLIGSRRTPDWVVLALLGIAGVLLLTNLGNGYLWQDEAETALLARNTLTFGYPRAFDGINFLEAGPFEHGHGEAWIYSPWLPFYVLAGVFSIAGQSTWAARLPFALMGLVSIYLTWRLACLVSEDRRIQRLSVALLTCSVPFLLHMRQCRYYAMATALVVGTSLAYLTFFRQPSMKRAIILGGLLVLLFHTHFGLFLPVVAALITHQLIWGAPSTRRRWWILMAGVAALTLPWVIFFYSPTHIGGITLTRIGDHLEYYVRITNKFLVPLALMGVVSGLLLVLRRSPSPRGSGPMPSPEIRWFFLLMVGVCALFVLLPYQRHMRYVIPILPLLLLGEAWWLVAWWRPHRLVGWAVVPLLLLTNVLQSVHVRVPLVDLAHELTHAYTGPMEGIVDYLRLHGRPEHVAKIPYDDRTLMFYTDVQVERPSQFLQESYPDWVIIRRDWIPGEFFSSAYFRRIEETYQRIELDAPDIIWQNREDPGSHHFRTVQEAPRVVIYRRRDASGV